MLLIAREASRAIAPRRGRQEAVGWTLDPAAAAIQHVRVDHRGLYITVTEEFLYRTNAIAHFEQVCRKTMPQRVRTDWLADARVSCRGVDGLLQHRLVDVKTLRLTKAGVSTNACRWKHPLPCLLAARIRVLRRQRIRHLHPAIASP